MRQVQKAVPLVARVDRLDPTGGSVGRRESLVGGDKCGVECLCKGHVHRIPAAHRFSELPCPCKQGSMPETFARPSLKVLDGLGGLGAIEMAAHVLAPDHSEDLYIDDVRSAMIFIRNEPLANCVGAGAADEHFAQT